MALSMVVVRLSRAGAVHKPFYHVVVADSRAKRDGKYIERLGFLNYYARGEEKPYSLDTERLEYWVSKGAVLRPSVRKLVRRCKRGDANPAKTETGPVAGKQVSYHPAAEAPQASKVAGDVASPVVAEKQSPVPANTGETPAAAVTPTMGAIAVPSAPKETTAVSESGVAVAPTAAGEKDSVPEAPLAVVPDDTQKLETEKKKGAVPASLGDGEKVA